MVRISLPRKSLCSQRGVAIVAYFVLLATLTIAISAAAEAGRKLPGPFMEFAVQIGQNQGGGSDSSLGGNNLTHGGFGGASK